MKSVLLTAVLSVGLPFAANAAIIDNGVIQMGVDTLGQLNVGGVGSTGLRYMPTNYEATAPGCLCEGWGVGIGETGQGGSANNANVTAGLTSVSFTNTASTATSVVTVDGTGLRVTHSFGTHVLQRICHPCRDRKHLDAAVFEQQRLRELQPLCWSQHA